MEGCAGLEFSLCDYLGLGLGAQGDPFGFDLETIEALNPEDVALGLDSMVPCLPDWELPLCEAPVPTGELTVAGKCRPGSNRCGRCGAGFQHRRSVRRHEASCCRVVKGPVTVTWDAEQFARTLRSCDGPTRVATGPPLTCPVCRALFSSEDKLVIHREEELARLRCCHCGKLAGSPAKLATHHRSHTKQRPFSCRFCEKRFTELTSLRKHTLTHGPPGHRCTRCDKAFVRKDYLKKHIHSGVCLKILQ
jgi:hypothetical protein